VNDCFSTHIWLEDNLFHFVFFEFNRLKRSKMLAHSQLLRLTYTGNHVYEFVERIESPVRTSATLVHGQPPASSFQYREGPPDPRHVVVDYERADSCERSSLTGCQTQAVRQVVTQDDQILIWRHRFENVCSIDNRLYHLVGEFRDGAGVGQLANAKEGQSHLSIHLVHLRLTSQVRPKPPSRHLIENRVEVTLQLAVCGSVDIPTGGPVLGRLEMLPNPID
jgi:hypothetical protein